MRERTGRGPRTNGSQTRKGRSATSWTSRWNACVSPSKPSDGRVEGGGSLLPARIPPLFFSTCIGFSPASTPSTGPRLFQERDETPSSEGTTATDSTRDSLPTRPIFPRFAPLPTSVGKGGVDRCKWRRGGSPWEVREPPGGHTRSKPCARWYRYVGRMDRDGSEAGGIREEPWHSRSAGSGLFLVGEGVRKPSSQHPSRSTSPDRRRLPQRANPPSSSRPARRYPPRHHTSSSSLSARNSLNDLPADPPPIEEEAPRSSEHSDISPLARTTLRPLRVCCSCFAPEEADPHASSRKI